MNGVIESVSARGCVSGGDFPAAQPAAAIQAGFPRDERDWVGILFAICTLLLMVYQLNKRTTIQMAEKLAERRKGTVQG